MYCPFQLVPMLFPATINMVAPSTAMAFQICMPSRWSGIDRSVSSAPARDRLCAAWRTVISTSGSELDRPKPSLTIPIRSPRASPVRRFVYASVRRPGGWRGSRPSGPAITSKSSFRGRPRHGAGVVEGQLNGKDARVWHKTVGRLVAHASTVRARDTHGASLVAADRHVTLVRYYQRRASARRATRRARRVVWIEDGPSVGSVTASGEAKMFADRLAHDFA